jgi:type IV pilus assembly protein PilQ
MKDFLKLVTLVFGIMVLLSTSAFGQPKTSLSSQTSRINTLSVELDSLANNQKGLLDTVQFNLKQIPINHLLLELGKIAQINMDIERGIHQKIMNSFSNVTVKEALLYLCEKYSLTIKISHRILFIKKYTQPLPPVIAKPMNIQYYNGLLSCDLRNDTLKNVTRKITELTGKNILSQQNVSNQIVNVFLKNTSVSKTLEKLAFANNLEFDRQKDGTIVLSKKEKNANNKNNRRGSNSSRKRSKADIELVNGKLNIDATDASLEDIVYDLFQKVDSPYFIQSKLEGKINYKSKEVSLKAALEQIFINSKYFFRYQNGVYSIGERKKEGIVYNKVVPIKYRKAEGFAEYIPENIKATLQISEHLKLNSLIVSGASRDLDNLEAFVKEIDLPVPVVNIDIIVIDYSKNNNLETGIQFGIGEEKAASKGSIFPSVDYTFGSGSINKILSSINGYSALNLGGVTPNFYLSLKALEENGILDIKSTPRLSTLNGEEANFKVGRQEYYRTQQTNIIGTQNPQTQLTENWQSVSASLDIKIKPNVTVNKEVILEITFDQTSFTERIVQTAPPGTTTRSLTSIIRVKNDDMILLGGLEEVSKNDTGKGVPFLSRIPILKWIFSGRSKSKRKSKLLVFVKPTIII